MKGSWRNWKGEAMIEIIILVMLAVTIVLLFLNIWDDREIFRRLNKLEYKLKKLERAEYPDGENEAGSGL